MSEKPKIKYTLFIGLYENHGAKVKKSRHTFRKVAKFTANSRCQFTVIYGVKNVSLTNTFEHFCSLPSQQSVMYCRLTKWLTLIVLIVTFRNSFSNYNSCK